MYDFLLWYDKDVKKLTEKNSGKLHLFSSDSEGFFKFN